MFRAETLEDFKFLRNHRSTEVSLTHTNTHACTHAGTHWDGDGVGCSDFSLPYTSHDPLSSGSHQALTTPPLKQPSSLLPTKACLGILSAPHRAAVCGLPLPLQSLPLLHTGSVFQSSLSMSF